MKRKLKLAKRTKIEKSKMKVKKMSLYSVIHEVVDTDHWVYSTSLVEAENKKQALEYFNTEVFPKHADWFQPCRGLDYVNLAKIYHASGRKG